MSGSWRRLQGNVAATFRSPLWRPKGLRYSLILFFFLLPLQTRYIFREVPLYEYGTLSIFLVEVLGWGVIGLWAITQRRHSEEPRDEESHTVKQGTGSFARLRMTLIGLVAVVFFSIIWAPDKLVALQGAIRLLEGVLLYLIMSASREQGTTKNSIATSGAWAFLVGAVLQASLGIYQFLTQSSFTSTIFGIALHDPQMLGTSVVQFEDQRWLRAYGGLPHPNVLGGYLVVALAIALMLLIAYQRAEQSDKIVCGRTRFCQLSLKVIIPILMTGIFFSFSRASWVAGIIVLGYLAVQSLRSARIYPRVAAGFSPPHGDLKVAATTVPLASHKMLCYIVLIMLYAALLATIYHPLVFTRLHGTTRLETKSRVERMGGLREGWELVKTHPIIGVGIGNYTQTLQQFRPGQPLYLYQPVHNVPLLVWAELGLIGLALFIAALYLIARQSVVNAFMLLCFFVLMTMDHYLWTLPFGILLFWSIIGMLSAKNEE
ncbi:MAG: O-antigen ligase family protein [bacterium]|nr:O-antigen ligase family protein [bacterium]